MTGVVTRDSAQRRPSDKHRSDARDTYNFANACLRRPGNLPCLILSASRPIPAAAAAATPPTARKRHPESRSCPDPPANRAPQCPRFRVRGPNIERGRSARRQRHHPAPRRPFPRINVPVAGRALQLDDSTVLRPTSASSVPLAGPDGRMDPSGRRQPPRRRRRRVTPQGRSASGGPAERVDSVTAVTFR